MINSIRPLFKWSLILPILCIGGMIAVQTLRVKATVRSNSNKNHLSEYRLDNFAAPDLVVNPVSMSIDEDDRLYVTQTKRITLDAISANRLGVSIRDDLMLNSVQDRADLLKKLGGDRLTSWNSVDESIQIIDDENHDGKADRSVVYADKFQDPADMIGAGILIRDDYVYFTCSPNLWRLKRCSTPDGRVDMRRELLITGFSPHFSGVGHGLHGLTWGPDGKLYFSVGDSGMNVKTKDASIQLLNSGAVLRCESDGSRLELFAWGLRNPEELAFNEYGDLFTADNDQDPGDQTRWIHVVEGGDYGWRAGVLPLDKSPWIRERLWTPNWKGQPAYIVPAVAVLTTNFGPCGLTYYPGVGFPKEYHNTFFLCNFGYIESNSGIQSIRVEPTGASYRLTHFENFVTGIIPTDVEFSWKGELYISRWEQGGNPSNNGRIDKLWYPKFVQSKPTFNKSLLSQPNGSTVSIDDWIKLMSSNDQRVRLRAQFLLADHDEAVLPLLKLAHKSSDRIARIHAIWALGRLIQKHSVILDHFIQLLRDDDSEVRAQTAKVLGYDRFQSALDPLIIALNDVEPRVCYHAAIALGKIGDSKAFYPLIQSIKLNADRDPVLRNAFVAGLAGIADMEKMEQTVNDPNFSVRLATLLTYRRLKSENVQRFLDDPDLFIKVEAARAVNDVPIPSAARRLAASLNQPILSNAYVHRALAACNMLGTLDDMRMVVQFAIRPDVDPSFRVEAIRLLTDWTNPDVFNIVDGTRQNIEHRSHSIDYSFIRRNIPAMIRNRTDATSQATISLIESMGVIDEGESLEQLAGDENLSIQTRCNALRVMIKSKQSTIKSRIKRFIKNQDPLIRIEVIRSLTEDEPRRAVKLLDELLNHREIRVRQKAWELLGEIPGPEADKLLIRGLSDIQNHRIDVAVELELLESVKKRTSSEVSKALKRIDSDKSSFNDLVETRRSTLYGGDSNHGEYLFSNGSGETACPRCHSIRYLVSGGTVGPDLAGVGLRHNRRYILESLVTPGRVVAKGYESTVLALSDGRILSGVVQSENDREIMIMTEGRIQTILKADIDDRTVGKSAMPEDVVKNYTDRDLRDLVEFLSRLGSESSKWSKLERFTNHLPQRTYTDYYQAGVR